MGGGLMLSAVPAELPTPFGVLGLNPAGAVLVGAMPQSIGSEPGRLTIDVANDPSMAGLTIYWQVFDIDALELTNTVSDTVLGH